MQDFGGDGKEFLLRFELGKTDDITSNRQLMADAEVVPTLVDCNAVGFAPVRTEGRFLRFRAAVDAGAAWTEAVGVHTDARPAGVR